MLVRADSGSYTVDFSGSWCDVQIVAVTELRASVHRALREERSAVLFLPVLAEREEARTGTRWRLRCEVVNDPDGALVENPHALLVRLDDPGNPARHARAAEDIARARTLLLCRPEPRELGPIL